MTERPEPQGDLTLFVPERITRAYDQRRAAWSGIDTIAAWLVAAHVLLLLVIVGRGALYMDDLRAQGYALNQPFFSFILGSNGTHFAPVPRILDWAQSRWAPLEHGPAVAVTLMLRFLLAVGFWRVLRRLFGPRLVTLVPFTMLLLTPALIPATTYYRQSITIVACTVTMVWAMDAHLRWVIYRHRGDLVALALITAVGLGCYEKAAMIPVILLALTVALFAGRARFIRFPGFPGRTGFSGRDGVSGRAGLSGREGFSGRAGLSESNGRTPGRDAEATSTTDAEANGAPRVAGSGAARVAAIGGTTSTVVSETPSRTDAETAGGRGASGGRDAETPSGRDAETPSGRDAEAPGGRETAGGRDAGSASGRDAGTGERPGAVRAGLVAVAMTGLLVVVFLLIYRSGPYDQATGGTPGLADVLHLLRDTVTRTMIPLLLGGPYHWGYPGAYVGVPLLNGTTRAFCLVIALVGLAFAAWRNPGRTARALLLLVAWTVPSVVIIAVGRFNELGFGLGTAVRLWADLVPAFLLAGALAALPWRVGVHREQARADGERIQAPEGSPPDGPPAPLEVTTSALAGALVVLVVLAGSVFSSLTYASKWWDNPTGLWVANARSSLENAEPYPRTLATPMPPGVIPSFVSLVFPTDAPLLLLMRPDIRFHDVDATARVMNPAGVRSAYVPKQLAKFDAKGICTTDAVMSFPKPTPYASGAQLEVGLLLGDSATVDVTVTTPDGKVLTPQRYSNELLTPGPRRLVVPMPYLKTVSSFSVRIHQKPGSTKISCVSDAEIWVPVT